MAQHWIILGIFVFFSGPFGFVTTQSTNVCKTFGSGVMQTFNTTMFHVKTTCPVTLTHFSHAGVDCFISVQRDSNGLIKTVEVLVNKIATIIQNGILTVEGNRVSLPYDHTYQKLYAFGIYTRLTSKVLPLSVTWYSLPEGVTSLWVELDRPLVDGMSGICGGINSSETQAQLLDRNVIRNGICLTGDSQPVDDKICSDFKSNARECLGIRLLTFDHLCKLNMYANVHESAKCSFCEEFMHSCNYSYTQLSKLRNIISCKEHHCPGDLQYKDQGAAFPPTCSNPQLQTELHTATCLPPNGLVLNDRVEGYHCVRVEDCPCVHRGRIYIPGEQRSTKCQTCQCINGKWICSANTCATPCIIEGWFVTTFDGKQYSLPGTCTYVAARGLNWTITIRYSAMTLDEIYLDVYQERYIFSLKSVQLRGNEITATDLSQTEYVTVYWQSSMFVMVKTFFGMKMQVQVSPVVQMYLYLPQNVTTTGLCGSNNNNTEDDFTTSSGIVENSAEPFALSWTLGDCTVNHPPACIHIDKEIFAEDRCNELKNTSGVFAQCHEYVPVNSYFDACVQRTCQATSGLEERVCVGLGNYAKACVSQGIIIGDWRAETGCIPSCESNLRFDYTMQACNHTCRSLSAPDLTCDISDDPVEGCGCLHGTHLNTPLRCSPRALCHCNYLGGTTPPGPVVIDGHQCMCENGILNCSDVCDCPHGQICVHCAQEPVNTVQKTCESLSKPSSTDESCISGCYCPEGQYSDHRGNCVTPENCTCEFSRMVYASGETVESNCKTCTCRGGHWDCIGDPCPGVCEVFGNGQYKTFDSKWYRFDGHCQYTLVEDIHGLFSISVESVPCCDEALTCSRAISVKLKDEVTLILRDMNVTQKLLNGWRFRAQSLYSVHTVGLYIIISVPELGLTVIWDKQTKVKIELLASWSGKVHGLCGDFDGKLINDLMTSSSTVVFSTLEFGNSWKTAVPPCSDVTQELFPCERHTYCAAWAERRCMIILSDTFKACHLKVDPASYYQACIMESCSCDFEGKFLGFCTAVAAYAGACTAQNVCIKWRTPDLCPVYCDYYNEEGQYSWHYEACPQQIKTCGKNNKFSGKLEGCYPQCPTDMPYYDENRRICTSLDQCTCYFNNTVVGPGAKVTTAFECCECIGGQLICTLCITPTTTVTSKATSVPNTTATTTASTPEITTKEYKTTPTSPITTSTMETPVTTRTTSSISEETSSTSLLTTTTEITPEESTLTTPITTTSTVTETTVTTTTSTPEITTEEHKTTTTIPITTTVTSKATSIPNTTLPISTTTTSIPSTTFDIRIGPPLTSITKQQESKNTTTPEITITKTTKESTTTTPITTTTAETIITTTTSTPEITTEHDITTTSTVTTERPSTTSTEITSVSETTTPLTPVSTRTPVMTTTTTTVITPEESVATTLLIRSSATTETPITTSTTEITTEKPTGTIVTTIPKSSSVIKTTTLTSVTTPEITPEKSTFTTPLTATSAVIETTVTTTTSTPEITPEESTFTTSLTGTSAVTETTVTTTTSTPEFTTEEHKTTTTTPITTITTKTPVITRTTSITSKESPSTTLLTTTSEITPKESTSTTPLTATSAVIETTVTTTTSTPEITPEESTFTTSLTGTSAVTETTVTTTTSTPEFTTEEHKTTTTTPITTITTKTPVTTRTTSITSKESPSTTLLTTTSEITPKESTSTTPLTATSAVIETTVTTTTSTPEITPEESTFTTSLIGTSAITETTGTTTTSTPEFTTEEHKTTTTTPITTITTKTPVTTRTTSITSKESPSTTLLTTTSEITPEKSTFTTSLTGTSAVTETTVTTTTSTPEITTEEHKTTTTTPITTIITEITETSVTTSEPPLTTTEATGTTLTSKITTVSKPTTQITATTTESPITTTTTSTQKITTKGIVTPVTTIAPPVNRTTILTPETTTPHNPTCRDLIRNQTWPEGYEWMEDCFTKICRNSVIELRPLTCPTSVIPVCPRGMPQLVKDKQGCCDTWQCDCQCDVFGDPHYTTFAGQDFVFLENCTYVLVEERTPQYHLRISVDNYDCETSASCAKGIIVQYQNNTVTLEVLEVPNGIPIIKATLNQATIKAPYQAYGFRFESTDAEVYVYIKDIRSYIFLSVWNTLQINLAIEYFFNNTQGQCGVCGGASCIRRNGLVESDNCCHKTAYEWIEDDPLKPYCQQARQHVPCFDNVLTTTISPSKTTPFCTAPLCDLLRHQVFSACSGDIDVERLVSSCKFDYCISQNNASVCSPLERLADHCKKMGICVAWRNLTGGICDIACPTGMIFDECRSTPNDFCRGSERVPGRVLDTVMSGCFCPENQLLSEAHKKICVSECTNCKGPLGEPMPVGAIWESNCHMCTCNNQTRTEECWPKLPLPPPTCSRGFALTSDCCNNQICVEKTCEYSGKIYKVGEMWRDPKNPCLTYHCTAEGTKIEQTMCPQQICPEELRIWDDHNCCYSCNTTCGVILSRMTLENCTQEVMLPTCEGNCAPSSLWVRSGNSLQLEHNQFCCRERAYEMRQISLLCSGTTATQYTYKHITSCECQREV